MKERGNEDALVDVEAEFAEPGFLREIGRRHAPVDAPFEELGHLRALGLRQPRVEEGLEAVERQVQRMQQQVGRLVVGVGRAVTEGERGFAEARHRVAQPVAQASRDRARRSVLIRVGTRPGGAHVYVNNRSRMPR